MVQRKEIVKKILDKKMRPVRPNYVFLLLDEIHVESRLDSGIIILSSTAKNEPLRTATVISVGEKVLSVEENDRVMIGRFMGTEVFHEDSDTCKLVLVSEDQIDVIVE